MSFVKKTKRVNCPFPHSKNQCCLRNDLNSKNIMEHLMEYPHSFTKEKATEMSKLVREKLFDEDSPLRKREKFNIENLINISSHDSSTSSPIITCGASLTKSVAKNAVDKEIVKSAGIRRLFVGDIQERTLTEHDLYHYFARYGKIIDIKIITSGRTWRGFGFVEFDQCASVDNIVREKHHVINGHTVRVEPAWPKPRSVDRSEGGNRFGNYSNEGGFRRSPAQYNLHGSGPFHPSAGFRSDFGQVHWSSQSSEPMRGQNNFGEDFGSSGATSRRHVSQARGFYERK